METGNTCGWTWGQPQEVNQSPSNTWRMFLVILRTFPHVTGCACSLKATSIWTHASGVSVLELSIAGVAHIGSETSWSSTGAWSTSCSWCLIHFYLEELHSYMIRSVWTKTLPLLLLITVFFCCAAPGAALCCPLLATSLTDSTNWTKPIKVGEGFDHKAQTLFFFFFRCRKVHLKCPSQNFMTTALVKHLKTSTHDSRSFSLWLHFNLKRKRLTGTKFLLKFDLNAQTICWIYGFWARWWPHYFFWPFLPK